MNDSLFNYSSYSESELQHKWNLRDYPFDKQLLKYVFQSDADTSSVVLKSLSDRKPEILSRNFEYLMDGYNVVGIEVNNTFKKINILAEYADGVRNKVIGTVEFLVSVDRDGAYLYFKLFFGGFVIFNFILSILYKT